MCNSSISLVSSTRSLTQQESIYNFLWKFFCENEAVNTRTTPRFTALNTLGGHFQRDTPHTTVCSFCTTLLIETILPCFCPCLYFAPVSPLHQIYSIHFIYRVSISLKKALPHGLPLWKQIRICEEVKCRL